jgi:phosphocarrier protein FPr
MFPMIATPSELREVRAIAERVRQEVGALPVEIGIMIEVPSALMAREFARDVDFFSVGTNDLAQYTLAMDRMHPEVGKGADGLHPAVLRLIEMTVKAADEAGKWVGVCGGVAGEPRGALALTGLGVTELSMSAPAIPNVKAALRRATLEGARRFAEKALSCRDAEEVRALPLPI